MRQATFSISPDPAGLHPADLAVARSAAIEQRSIRAYSTLADGSWLLLYAVRGDLEAGRGLLADRQDVRRVVTAPTSEDGGLAFVHVEASPTLDTLAAIAETEPLVARVPIPCLPDGGVRLTVLGTEGAIQSAVERAPESVSVELEAIGGFTAVVDALPPRQTAVLEAAVEHGYYASPRECSQRDLADALDLAPATISEHLRKIEARVMPGVAERPLGTDRLPERTG